MPDDPRDLTAKRWRALADDYADAARDQEGEAQRAADDDSPELSAVMLMAADRYRALAAACRAMALGCDPTLRVAPRDDSGWAYPCAVEVAGRMVGAGDTLTAALLDAAGEGA